MSESKKLKSTMIIGTHSGTFHADESLAVYMLKLLPEYATSELIRSRDPEVLETCDIIVDVGGKYEEPKYFDHHQRGFTETFSDDHKTKLSSAGLVYKHFGKKVIGQILKVSPASEKAEALYSKIYEDFIEAIDANDNGIAAYPDTVSSAFKTFNITLPGMVSKLNPLWTEPSGDSAFDRQFEKASKLMGEAFVNVVLSIGNGWYPAKEIVQAAMKERYQYDKEGRVLLFDEFVPWKDHLHSLESELSIEGKILYVLYKDSAGSWRIQCVPESSSSFVSRKPLPEPWRGVRDDELSKLTGIPGCVFVHASGFIGGNKTKEGVLTMCEKSLEI